MVYSVESKIAVQSGWRGKTDILQPSLLCNCAVRFQESVILLVMCVKPYRTGSRDQSFEINVLRHCSHSGFSPGIVGPFAVLMIR